MEDAEWLAVGGNWDNYSLLRLRQLYDMTCYAKRSIDLHLSGVRNNKSITVLLACFKIVGVILEGTLLIKFMGIYAALGKIW